MLNKVMIVGTGNVGATIGYALVNQNSGVRELILTDLDSADAEGEALDLNDCLAVAPTSMNIKAGSYKDAKDCDIIIITAGAAQKPGETRLELLQKNAKIIKSIVDEIMQSGFNGIFLLVTNPVDVISYLTWQYSGLPPEQIIGSGTVLDSARLRLKIAKALDVHPKSVHAYQIGEHGDTEFALWSSANLGGHLIKKLMSSKELDQIENFAKNEAYEIINKKGATYYGIGACVANIVSNILNDERRVLPVSSYDDLSGIFTGFPTVLGKSGVIRRLNLQMTEQESLKMQHSINTIKSAINTIIDIK